MQQTGTKKEGMYRSLVKRVFFLITHRLTAILSMCTLLMCTGKSFLNTRMAMPVAEVQEQDGHLSLSLMRRGLKKLNLSKI
jgi:hypothetical protein